jgi:hypothetical protein
MYIYMYIYICVHIYIYIYINLYTYYFDHNIGFRYKYRIKADRYEESSFFIWKKILSKLILLIQFTSSEKTVEKKENFHNSNCDNDDIYDSDDDNIENKTVLMSRHKLSPLTPQLSLINPNVRLKFTPQNPNPLLSPPQSPNPLPKFPQIPNPLLNLPLELLHKNYDNHKGTCPSPKSPQINTDNINLKKARIIRKKSIPNDSKDNRIKNNIELLFNLIDIDLRCYKPLLFNGFLSNSVMKNTNETVNLTIKNKNKIIINLISKLLDVICNTLGGPVLFLIDDIHFLDIQSLSLLKYLWDYNNFLTIICTYETVGCDMNNDKNIYEKCGNIEETWKDCDGENENENENEKNNESEKNENETFFENENEIFEYFLDKDKNGNRFIDIKLEPLNRCAILGMHMYTCIYIYMYLYIYLHTCMYMYLYI